MVVDGGVYMEEEEEAGGGGGGGGGGRGDGGGGGGGGVVTGTAPVENKAKWWEGIIWWSWWVSVYLYLRISALTAFNSACRDCTWCCKAEMAPMHP